MLHKIIISILIILISLLFNPCLFFALIVGVIFFGTIIDKMIPHINKDNIKLNNTIEENIEDLTIIISLTIFAIITTFNCLTTFF